MADALTKTDGPPPSSAAAAAASAKRRVGPLRLSMTARLWRSLKRPAMDAPARCTTASTPSRSRGPGLSGSHWRSPGPVGGCRTNRTTLWPPVVRNAARADPISPEDPVMATVSGSVRQDLPRA